MTADPGSVVLIGPTAGQVDAIGIAGERSPGLTARQVGPLDALKRLGHVKGDEVAQVYLGVPTHPPSGVQFPVRKLVAFDRFTLGAGRTRRIHVHIPQRQLKYWSSASHQWVTALGARKIHVGASSRDLRLEADTTLQ